MGLRPWVPRCRGERESGVKGSLVDPPLDPPSTCAGARARLRTSESALDVGDTGGLCGGEPFITSEVHTGRSARPHRGIGAVDRAVPAGVPQDDTRWHQEPGRETGLRGPQRRVARHDSPAPILNSRPLERVSRGLGADRVNHRFSARRDGRPRPSVDAEHRDAGDGATSSRARAGTPRSL
jgi:hypothetical protein